MTLRFRQTGTATVEFTLTLPLLLLLLLGVSEFARAIHQYNTVTEAVRDGVRYAADNAVAGSLGFVVLSSSLVDSVQNRVVYGNTAGSGSPLLPGWTTAEVSVSSPDTKHVRVAATYTYAPLLGSALAGLLGQDTIAFPLQATVTMRAL